MAALTVGGHVSSAGGPLKALERGQALGFTGIQMHPTAPQSWAKPTVSDETAAEFKARMNEYGICSAFFHNIYLNNFATPLESGWHASIAISTAYLTLASKMGVSGTVTHLGSHKGAGMEIALPRITEGLKRVLAETPDDSIFTIENTAGAGGTIGRSLEEIQMIIDSLGDAKHRVSVCIDTCHAYASGIPIHTLEGFNIFMAEFEQRLGLQKLACMHMNDSKGEFGSNKDRHENIGDGQIGYDGFRHIVNDPRVASIPLLMEVPGLEEKGPDVANRERIEALIVQ